MSPDMQVNPNTNEWQREAQLDRLGHSLAHSLSTHVAPDIQERLRIAREQAVAQALRVTPEQRLSWLQRVKAHIKSNAGPWWNAAAVTAGAAAFAVSFFAIQSIHQAKQTSELAEVDTELLTDDLPIEAYSDPAFMRFLRSAEESDAK